MDLDETRRAILDTVGHLLIEGGPGSGKTTIALLKAARTVETLEPEQRVLFLSFSRAAVRQISDRLAEHLPRAPRSPGDPHVPRLLPRSRPRARVAADRNAGRIPAARRRSPPQGRP